MLTEEQQKELQVLRGLQKRPDRFFLQQEFDRLNELSSLQNDKHCLNPVCTGGYFPDLDNCPECNKPLHIHSEI